MLIVCPGCATSYQVEPSSLGATGRSVRCVRCRKTWFAANPEAMAAIARSHQEDIAAFTAETSVADIAEGRPSEPAGSTPVAEVTPAPATVPDEPASAPDPELVRDDRGPAPIRERADEPAPPPPSIDHAPALVPETPPEPAAAAAPVIENIESVAARRIRRPPPRRKRHGSGWAVAALALITVNAGLVAFRADVVRFLPQTAALYAAIGLPVNLRGLVFTDIVTRKEMQDGTEMLLVEGVIQSNSRRNAEVPRLRFALRNAAGQELHSWTALPARNVIAPGATLPFHARLASPPPEAHSVLVRFFNRRDVAPDFQ